MKTFTQNLSESVSFMSVESSISRDNAFLISDWLFVNFCIVFTQNVLLVYYHVQMKQKLMQNQSSKK